MSMVILYNTPNEHKYLVPVPILLISAGLEVLVLERGVFLRRVTTNIAVPLGWVTPPGF